MTVLYLVEQGATLRKSGDVLVVEKQGVELQHVPAIKVQQVVIFGNISITTQAIGYLLENGIDTVFLSSRGRYHGRLVSPESKYGELRRLQLAAATDEGFRLSVARATITGKLKNQRTMLMRYGRQSHDSELERAVNSIEVYLGNVQTARTLDELRGFEGNATAFYFGAFKRLLREDLGFRLRVRRPPTDPVNSLLSFGYTLLAYAMQSAIHTVGLDPYIGFLHSTEYARPALALDMMEEFRCILVDSVVLRLLNTGQLSLDDFEIGDEGSRAVLIREDGKKRFLSAYEDRMNTEIAYPLDGRKVTYRRSLELQVRQFARLIRGELSGYSPLTVR